MPSRIRPASSTTLALQNIRDDIILSLKAKYPTLAIYADLSKAYDTIKIPKLISKLRKQFNFTENTAQFFATYFQNRQQSTHTTHAQSSFLTITDGIPQGSTLSTTFFLLYINDIIHTVVNSKVYTYADDTTLIIKAPTVNELQQTAEKELTKLTNYFYNNNLKANPTKTVYTVLHPSPKPEDFQITVHGTTLQHTESAKLLGIYIDSDMKHTHTINNQIRKLHPIIQNLKYVAKLVPQKTMINIYNSHVLPHMTYCITVWGTTDTSKGYIKPMQQIQKKIIRILFKKPPRTHTKPLMNKHKILSIYHLYTQRIATELWPHLNNPKKYQPEHKHKYTYVDEIHKYNTRQATTKQLFTPHTHTTNPDPKLNPTPTTRQYTSVWNELPPHLRAITDSLNDFKKKLKDHLLKLQANEQ